MIGVRFSLFPLRDDFVPIILDAVNGIEALGVDVVPPQGSVVMRPCRLVVRGVPGREGDGLDRAGVRAAVWR